MKKHDVKFTAILGPGNHQQKLVEALKSNRQNFELFNYFPVFSHTIYNSSGEIVYYEEKVFLTKIVNALWALIIRIRPLKNKNYQSAVQYIIFDYWVSINISDKSSLLWAWAQNSVRSIKKMKQKSGRVILEHPTIHVDEWNIIINKEYEQFAPDKYKYYVFSRLLTNRIRKECLYADEIVLLSEFSEMTFNKHADFLHKLRRVNLYADELFIRKAEVPKSSTAFNILYVGRIDLIKGIHRLLPVFDKLTKKNSSIYLTLIGEVKEEMEEILSKYTFNICVKRHLPKTDLVAEYHHADLLILPSVQESFGLVMLEALASGTPVLGSIYTGAPDIAKHTKEIFIFDPLNEKDFEEKLALAIDSLRSANVVITENQFSKENYENQVRNIINRKSVQ